MKAYLIDPAARTITAVDVAADDHGSHLKSMYAHLDCHTVDVVREVIPGHDVWIDDEGALYDDPPHGLFYIKGKAQHIYAGRALVTGYNDDGDTLPATCKPGDILERIYSVLKIDQAGQRVVLAPLDLCA